MTERDIKAVRESARIGQLIRVHPVKSAKLTVTGKIGEVTEWARITDIHPKFCTVMLPGGVKESFLWQEFLMRG